MTNRSMVIVGALVCAALLGPALPAQAAATRELVVLTSFPKELCEAYKQAFEQKVPGVKVIVKQHSAKAAYARAKELVESASGRIR
jgi:hypothetical protein